MGCGASTAAGPVPIQDGLPLSVDGASKQTWNNPGEVGRAEEVGWHQGKHASSATDDTRPVWHLDVQGGLVLSKDALTEGLADRMRSDCVGQLFDLLDFNHDGRITIEDFLGLETEHASHQEADDHQHYPHSVAAPESLGVTHPAQASKLGTTTLHNVNLALWEATKRIATAAPEDAEGWQVAQKHLVYAQAGLALCRACDAKMHGLGPATAKCRMLAKAVPARVRCTIGKAAGRRMWQRMGLKAPRAERAEWKERLAVRPVIQETPRNPDVDAAILHGRLSSPAIRRKVTEETTRTVRFLVSSTFTDTNEERNMFLSDVLPYIQEYARTLRIDVHMVEMRWGIRSEASQSHETSEICMRELSRALRESLAVAYVFLATQRYGFRPLPPKIPQEYFEALRSLVPAGEAQDLMDHMFSLDENATSMHEAVSAPTAMVRTESTASAEEGEIPEWDAPREFAGPEGPYYLLRSSKDDSEWWTSFDRLRTVLRAAATALWKDEVLQTRSPECRHFVKKLFISVTEEELSRGLLWLSPERQEQALVYSRTIGGDATAWGGGDASAFQDLLPDGEIDHDASRMVKELGAMLPEGVPKRSYGPLEWGPGLNPDENKGHREYLTQIADDFASDLLQQVASAARKAAVARDVVLEEAQHHLRFAFLRSRNFCQTASTRRVFANVHNFLTGEATGKAFVVYGRSGAGKTYLMSSLIAVTSGASSADRSHAAPSLPARERHPSLGLRRTSTNSSASSNSSFHRPTGPAGNANVESIPGTSVNSGNGVSPRNSHGVSNGVSPTGSPSLGSSNLGSIGSNGSDGLGLLRQRHSIGGEGGGARFVVARFLGTSPQSSTVRALLESLCRQLARAYERHEVLAALPSEFPDLKALFRTAVTEWPNFEHPLFLFIDSVDQLDDSDGGRTLEWLPVVDLPAHVRIVISTLPDNEDFSCLSQLRESMRIQGKGSQGGVIAEVETISDPLKVLEHILKGQGRKITQEQMLAVSKAFDKRKDADIGPLWIRIVAQMLTTWRSFDGVRHELKSSVRDIIVDLFARLEALHGKFLVVAALAYITLSRGIAEGELLHLLSLEDDVLADVYEWWVPPIRTAPPLLLTRLLGDLLPYLSRRGDGIGVELLSWYHRQFWEASDEFLFGSAWSSPQIQRRHKELADFFSGSWAGRAKPYNTWLAAVVQRPHFFPGEVQADRQVPAQPLVLVGSLQQLGPGLVLNLRRITSLVHHLIRGGDETRAVEELCSCTYIAAKMAAHAESGLMREYAEAIEEFPAARERLGQVRAFVARQKDALRDPVAPTLAFQLAEQEPDCAEVRVRFKQEQAALLTPDQVPVVRWTSRKNEIDPCILTIHEHEHKVHAAAWSPCGGFVAMASADKKIKIFSVQTGVVRHTLIAHTDAVISLAWGLGDVLASGSRDKTVIIWDPETGKVKKVLEGHTDRVLSIAFSPDDRYIISGSRDRSAWLWDLANESKSKQLLVLTEWLFAVAFSPNNTQVALGSRRRVLIMHVFSDDDRMDVTIKVRGGVVGLSFSPEGDILAMGGWDAMVSLIDPVTGDIFSRLEHDFMVASLSWSPDSQFIVTGSFDNHAYVWHVDSSEMRQQLTGHTGPVLGVQYSRDGTMIATGSGDATCKIWQPKSEEKQEDFCLIKSKPKFSVQLQYLSVCGRHAGIAHSSGTGTFYDLDTGAQLGSVRHPDEETSKEEEDAISAQIVHTLHCIAFAPDCSRIVTAGHDCTARVWDAKTKEELVVFRGHASELASAVFMALFSPDGTLIASVSNDKTIRVWDSFTGEEKICFEGNAPAEGSIEDTGFFFAIAWSPDGKGIGGSLYDNRCVILDLATKSIGRTFVGHSGVVLDVCFSRDSKLLITGSDDKSLRVWDVESGQPLWSRCLTHQVVSVGTSPCGTHIVCTIERGMVLVFDARGTKTNTFKADKTKARSLCFSDNGEMFVGCGDCSVRSFDPLTGALGKVFKGETRWVTSLCFSADGSSVAAGRADKTISCWDWESERLRFTVKGHINLITAVAFSPDGSCLASGSFGDVVLRDAASGTEQRRLSPFPGWATMLWFSKDGGRVLASSEKAGSGDIDARVQEDTAHAESGRPEKVDAATVVCWDVATGELLTPLDKDLEDAVGQKQSRDAGPSGRLCIDRTTHHVITAEDDVLLIHAIPPGRSYCCPELNQAAPVACFSAPAAIKTARVRGTRLCVGLEDGEVIFLEADLLRA